MCNLQTARDENYENVNSEINRTTHRLVAFMHKHGDDVKL